ncbi:pyroglutamyl-peptidase I [Halalkalibacter alkaliphilus]|uniref:Pyrrolidone-carboxylate peptidase n=1 Tax=Halalkalibacter alkaliphilus TaxID=2917993 RepID=A0A9X1ZYK7_9BACI|nr:pyroglutamyl-peptidase I [Halalkalibacter alkaliphilus]MCL7746751.1 pyroglutamyl-peptidase I [Halalkalibacter alkaliphilus]
MRVLLTGFVPFLDHGINPTEAIARELNGQQVGNKQIIGEVLPVTYSKSGKQLIKLFEEHQPDAVIMLGLAAGRNRITPERIAINCSDGEVDNEGQALQDALIREDGPAAYFSTLPIREMVNKLNESSIPAQISNTAGTYLCNNIMFQMLDYLKQHHISCPAGFIHLPASYELAVMNARLPSMSQQELTRAVTLLLECIIE